MYQKNTSLQKNSSENVWLKNLGILENKNMELPRNIKSLKNAVERSCEDMKSSAKKFFVKKCISASEDTFAIHSTVPLIAQHSTNTGCVKITLSI